MRSVFVCLLVASMLVVTPTPSRAGIGGRPETATLRRGLDVLHAWDGRREAAWRSSDARTLRALYLPRSSAAGADVRLLRAYTARGLVVRRIRTQVFSVRVLRSGPGGFTLRVVDRVAAGLVASSGGVRRLPSTAPLTRTITFRRTGGRWLVASVRSVSDSVRDPRAAPP